MDKAGYVDERPLMFRSLLLSAVLFSVSASAFADHPGSQPSAAKAIKTLPQLPNDADIEDIMANMPDLNALMGDMMKMMSDPEMQSTMKRAGETLERKMETSGAMDIQDNGLPDMNAAMGAMLSMLSDKDTMGGMMEMMGGMAEMMEEHVPEAATTVKKPK